MHSFSLVFDFVGVSVYIVLMRIETTRDLKIFKSLLGATQPVTSQELASLSGASSRTIKSEIALLNVQLQKENIGVIESVKGQGYVLHPLSEDLFHQFCEQVRSMDSIYFDRSVEHMNAQLFIMQMLLAHEYIKAEDLCDAMFVSKSSLAEDLNAARSFIESYHLSVVSVPGKGMHIQGLEQDYRSCFSEVSCGMYRDFLPDLHVKEMDALIYSHRQDYEDIRHAMLKIVRESKMRLRDIYTKKIAVQLCLAGSRMASGHSPHIAGPMRQELAQTYEYQLAQQIAKTPEVMRCERLNETEILNLARLLIVGRDFDLSCENDLETTKAAYINASRQNLNRALQKMQEADGQQIMNMDLFRIFMKELESICLHIYLEDRFDHLSCQRITSYNDTTKYDISPMMMNLTRILIQNLEEIYGDRIRGGVIVIIAQLFNYLLRQTGYSYQKRRFAVVSWDSIVIARQMRQSLLEHYGSYIERADIFEQYEMRRIKFADYDGMIAPDARYTINRYPLPALSYNPLGVAPQPQKIFEQLILPGFVRTCLEELIQMTELFPDMQVNDYEDLVRLVCYRHLSGAAAEQVMTKWKVRGKIFPYLNPLSGITVLFFDYIDTKKEFVEVYQPAASLPYHSVEVNYVIAVSCRADRKVQDLKLMDRMLQKMACSIKAVESLLQDPVKGWNDLFYQVTYNHFLYSGH